MIDLPVGESAAVVTSVLWTTCSILFAASGKRIGALSVNAYRIILAAGFLGGTHIFFFGTVVPEGNNSQFLFLALSGIIGLGLGDFAYFGTLIYVGPRRGVLLMSLAPIFAVVSAIFILDEIPVSWALLGIVVTLTGVVIVIHEKEGLSFETPLSRRKKIIGVGMGLCAALGQGLGLVISKYAMDDLADSSSGPMNPLSVALVRMVAAAIFVWIVVIVSGRLGKVIRASRDRKGMELMAGGAFFGPFLGVWMSMVAIAHTIAGVAATLMALPPVMIIPGLWILYKQRTNWRGICGAVVTVIGVAVLFLCR